MSQRKKPASQNGLVRISGGVYPISKVEGYSIAAFVPPPALESVDWSQLGASHQFLLENFHTHWQILAHWFVYLRTGAVDIKKKPFTLPEFTDKRPEAEFYDSQLELCKAVWEAIDITHHYPTPYHWWESCMVEMQQIQIAQILDSAGVENPFFPKRKVEKGLREFLQNLRDKEIILLEGKPETQHMYRLYEESITVGKNSKTVKKAWNDYLKKFSLRIRALKENSEVKSLHHSAMGLYYQEQGRLMPILTRVCNK